MNLASTAEGTVRTNGPETVQPTTRAAAEGAPDLDTLLAEPETKEQVEAQLAFLQNIIKKNIEQHIMTK